jgi:hypothetical protein
MRDAERTAGTRGAAQRGNQRGKAMTWIEIINARLTGVSKPWELKGLFSEIRAHVEVRAGKMVRLAFFRNNLVENDWSIHIRWKTRTKPTGKTELGIKLAEILTSFALVDHSIWVEEQLNDLDDPRRWFNDNAY